MDMSDRYQLSDDNSSVMEESHALIYLKKGLISCYQIFALISAHGLISLWHIRRLRMGKIDVITYKYVINHIIINLAHIFRSINCNYVYPK
jgi:hypothetical protein